MLLTLGLLVVMGANPWDASVAAFVDGDLTGAIQLEDACAAKGVEKCKSLAAAMREFSDLNKHIEDLDKRGFQHLLDLDTQITGGKRSKLARQAGLKLGMQYCKEATAAKAAGQFSRAGEQASRALKADPQNTCALNILQDLKQKADELFMQQYKERDPDANAPQKDMGDFPTPRPRPAEQSLPPDRL